MALVKALVRASTIARTHALMRATILGTLNKIFFGPYSLFQNYMANISSTAYKEFNPKKYAVICDSRKKFSSKKCSLKNFFKKNFLTRKKIIISRLRISCVLKDDF